MKDIDFLPHSYKRSRSIKSRYKMQYIFLVMVIGSMIMWSFHKGVIVSNASAELELIQENVIEQNVKMQDVFGSESEHAYIKDCADLLDKINDNVTISYVMAELSCLLSEDTVLERFLIESTPIKFQQNSSGGNTIRSASSSKKNVKSSLPNEPTKFLIIIKGYARDASDVAELLKRLEESEYFIKVVPGYARNKDVKGISVTEFEVNMVLANFKEKKANG